MGKDAKQTKKNAGRPKLPPVCDGDCLNCKFDDCILTDRELVRQMRQPKKKIEIKPRRKYQRQQHRIGKLTGEFKSEYILTPLPGSPEVQRKWRDDSES